MDDVKAYIIIGNLLIYVKVLVILRLFPWVNILDTCQREWKLLGLGTATLS